MSFVSIRNFILGFVLTGFLPLSTTGQTLQLPFDRLTVEDGLPNPSVLEIIQDEQGFMWFGTFSGIARYDGYSFTIYRPGYGERDSLPQRDLPRFFQDREGRLWLGMSYQDCKLYQYEPALDRFLPFQYDTIQGEGPIPSEYSVSSITQDKKGRLLVGTLDAGLFVLDLPAAENGIVPVKQYYQSAKTALDSILINSISGTMSEDERGNIWIPTEGGLFSWNPDTGQFLPFRLPASNEVDRVFCYSTFFDPPYTLWVGTSNAGLVQIDTRDHSFVRHKLPKIPGHKEETGVFKMEKGADNQLLILTNKNIHLNLMVLDIGSGYIQQVKDRIMPLREEVFTSIHRDYAGNWWLGSWQEGVFKFDPERKPFQLLQFPASGISKENATITAITQDSKGRIWLGTKDHGLAAWEPEQQRFTHIFAPDDYPILNYGKLINSIVELEPRKFLIGSDANFQLLDLSQDRLVNIPLLDNIARTKIWPHTSKKWWVTHWDIGLFELDVRSFSLDLELAHSGLTTLKEQADGTLFLGGNQFGLISYSPKTGHKKEYFKNYGVHDIQFDDNGIVWFSTHSAGLKVFDPKTETEIPLPSKTMQAVRLCRKILKDEQGRLWTITDQGIVSIDPESRSILQTFKASNWLAPEDFWYNQYTAGTKLKDGTLIFGSASGALLFHPDSLQANPVLPNVNLTGLQIANELIEPGTNSPLSTHISRERSIRLAYDQNDLTLSFSAMLFKSPESYRYRYRLLPDEQSWTNAGSRNKAYYTNLKAGHYTFEVQAAYGDGPFNEEGRHLEIIIRPPWWNHWVAWILYAIVFLLLSWGIIRFFWQRIETRRLRELDGLKTRFFTNITHEFRTPLTLILGLADKLKTSLGTAHQGDLKKIENNGQQLLRLVNQLLDLSKLEDGSLKLKMVQDDVIPFIKYLVEAFQSLANQRKIHLSFQSEPDQLLLDFDPDHLQRIISNLLSNALKFTPDHGEVMLRLEKIRTKQLLIRVKDTGIGIAPEEIDRIFDRFYQTDSSMTRKAEGTGIGLALSKELVQLMGGRIEIESRLGAGTEFRVFLPIRQEAPVKTPLKTPVFVTEHSKQSEAQPSLAANAEDNRPLVLIAEDNSDLREYLRTCLEETYQIVEAENGREGLQLAEANIPDVIISDIMMPEMDGFELCRQLKNSTVCSHIPIILLTAKADVESRLEGFELGAEAYLPKPFLKEELLIRVRKLLQLREELKRIYQHWLFEPAAAAPAKIQEPEKAFIRQIRQIVEDHLDDGTFGVNELAQAMEVSRSQLNRKFNQLTDQSPGQFIRIIRMQKARELLKDLHLHISEIAYQCGFNDPYYFSKVFKQEEGMTPSDYRKNLD